MSDEMTATPSQEAYIEAEAAKIGITPEALKARIELVNNASNTFGQLALQLTEGNWDVALSIAGTFFASTMAQNALHNNKTIGELWTYVTPGVEDTARILYEAFAEAEQIQREANEDAMAETTQGIATTLANDTPKVG